jgi:hypothetical protein
MNRYGGPAKSNKFFVFFRPRNTEFTALTGFRTNSETMIRDIPFLCEVAELPGRGLETVDVRYYGPNQKLPFQTRYEDINMSFICRSQSTERQFFDDWMNVIHPNNKYDFLYLDDYSFDIDIHLLSDSLLNVDDDSSGELLQYKMTLERAYPILINPQPITWADSEFLRLGISFTYSRYTRVGLDPVNLTLQNNQLVFGRSSSPT